MEIVNSIRMGYSYATAYERSGDWVRGEVVEVVGGTDFIRTVGNDKEENSLGIFRSLRHHTECPAGAATSNF